MSGIITVLFLTAVVVVGFVIYTLKNLLLVSSPNAFRETQAEPLPGRTVARDAAGGGRYVLDGGRVITRDEQPLVRIERVDLGDARYALSPNETDELGARIVRLLNRKGAR